MESIRDRLRAVPSFPDQMPALETEAVPDDPDRLFLGWLDDAIASGARQPNALSLATLSAEGTPVTRMVILKDRDERGYWFSTHRDSKKGLQVAANPRASMLFFWRESGRQVRITGTVVPLDDETSQADWRTRPAYAGAPNPAWQVYALQATEFEFLQARLDRKHVRVAYHKTTSGWTHARVTTPAG
ncbi:MAG TPA: pyridoxamine 5'-phosphate oxidase family protein [Microbacteriaceae bacterium]|nr:pyridoxamine 5'-phosphate oxidase family protein [Microbacteriaceae bacterium]